MISIDVTAVLSPPALIYKAKVMKVEEEQNGGIC
jgi:hypothetical protein